MRKVKKWLSLHDGSHSVITLGLVFTFAAIVTHASYLLLRTNRGMSLYELENEVARLASMLFFNKLTTIAQLTVALLGAAWAFRTLAGTQVNLHGWYVATCFWLTNLSFGLSLIVFYGYGYDFIVGRMFHHLTFDIDAPFVRLVSNYQLIFFIFGCICLLFTVMFGMKRAAQ